MLAGHHDTQAELGLEVRGLCAAWGGRPVLSDVGLCLPRGTITALVGPNGAGKTSLLLALSGLCPAASGHITLLGREISALSAHRRVAAGLSHCPEGRRIFARMSVEENILLGAFARPRGADIHGELGAIYAAYPRLKERRRQAAGTLSGGEQQLLALARATLAKPQVLLLDEPSLGLAPQMTAQVMAAIVQLARVGLTILLVEQNAALALRVAQRGYVLEMGRLVLAGTAEQLAADPRVREAYLGEL